MRYRYSRWSGNSDVALGPDTVIDALADDLASGAVDDALRAAQCAGITTTAGDHLPGLQELIERIDDERASILSSDVYAELVSALESMCPDEPETSPALTPRDETHGGPEDAARTTPAGTASAVAGAEPITASESSQSLTGPDGETDAAGVALTSARHSPTAEGNTAHINAALASPRANASPGSGTAPGGVAGAAFGAHGDPIATLFGLLDRATPAAAAGEDSPYARGTMDAGTRLADEPQAATATAVSARAALIQDARDLLERLTQLEQVRGALLAAASTGQLESLDIDALRDVVGRDAASACEQWIQLRSALEAAGYLRRGDDGWTLTPRAVRRIGVKIVERVFARMGRGPRGDHETRRDGFGVNPVDESKRYEFGDPMALDVRATVMNAVYRAGPGVPLRLSADDFEVHRSLERTSAATVLLLDSSRSMPLRGCFVSGRKVAIALHALLRERYPRDRLHVLAFGAGVQEIDPLSLPALSSLHGAHGTNVQAALTAARRLLGASRSGTRQIILITDGEPTAHTETDGPRVAYPPVEATLHHTLREVLRCTREGIVINTFMLGRSASAIHFVETVARLNGGRAFFASPERLDEYVILDYMTSRPNT
jgi:Mg-chelatase subunit ChlD